jgi:hypothetical protein
MKAKARHALPAVWTTGGGRRKAGLRDNRSGDPVPDFARSHKPRGKPRAGNRLPAECERLARNAEKAFDYVSGSVASLKKVKPREVRGALIHCTQRCRIFLPVVFTTGIGVNIGRIAIL